MSRRLMIFIDGSNVFQEAVRHFGENCRIDYGKFIIETLKTILHEIYVLPEMKADRLKSILKLREDLEKDKKRNIKT